MKKLYWIFVIFVLLLVGVLIGEFFKSQDEVAENNVIFPSRGEQIPIDAIKMTPQTDLNPPKSLTVEFFNPIPVPGEVNTAGAEDSAFITPDGKTLYFFFVPDVKVPIEKQVLDPTVGIYESRKEVGLWNDPIRIVLQEPGKLAMDGCEFIQDNVMYFCSAREGYTGLHWFIAEFKDGKWQNWQNVDQMLKLDEFETGELHISSDGNQLYFHSSRMGEKGGLDIWLSEQIDGEWSSPVNVDAVNSETNEGWPALSPDGNELWFSRDYGIWRSVKVNEKWLPPEQMFSPLAGEPSIDREGNVYFTHHYYRDDEMIEADIYVAYRK